MIKLEPLLPVLQHTSTLSKTLQGLKVKNDNPQSLRYFTLAIITGVAESITYLALSCLHSAASSYNHNQNARYYLMQCKGAWSALTIGIIGIWDKTFAASLPDRLEELCDEQWNSWIKSSEKEVKLKLQKERKEIVESLRQEDFAVRTRLISKWENNNEKLKKRINDYIADQKAFYPTLKRYEKYPALQKLKDTLHNLKVR